MALRQRVCAVLVSAVVALLSYGLVVDGAEARGGAYAAQIEAAITYYFPWYEEDDARYIVACESDFGADIYNEYSQAYGPWQFMPETAYAMGYDPWLMDDPWYSTEAAYELWLTAGWSPWACAY